MPIQNVKAWKEYEKVNKDPYGGCCVDVAREVMRMLDESREPIRSCHALICKAEDNIRAGGITGFMAGCVAAMVSKVHSRGEEFRKSWNLNNQIGNEGEKANKDGRVLNPALLTISDK